jgi:HEAT repeat protein
MRRKHRLIIKQLQTKDSVFWKPYTRLKDKSPSFVSKLLPAWPEPAQTRLAALNIFNHGPFGRDAFIRQAIPSLFRIAKQDPQPNIRLAAIAAIGRLGHLSDGAMPLLCSFAETDPDSHIRSAAIRAMSHLADSSSSAVRIMLRALCSDELHDRECAARWFGRTTLIPEKAVPELVRRLEDPGMKSEAATALTRYAAKAQFAVPRLIELAKSSDRDISSVAVWALLAIDRDAAAGAGIKAY